MNLKKAALAGLLVMAAAFAFAGGGNQGAAQSGGKTTLKVSVWDLGTVVDEVLNIHYQFKQEFEKLHPDITIEYLDTPSSDYTQKLTVMLNGGSDVDVLWIKDGDTTASYNQRGQLADLNPYLNRDNINRSAYSSLSNLTMGGKLVAMPARTDYYVLYYNKDIFDKAGVPYPTNDMTWAEWEALCARLTSGSGTTKIYGGFFHTWNACVQNWGVQDGKNSIMATDYSFFKPYYEMALRLQKAGYVWDYGALRSGGISYSNAFLQGNVATLPMGTWFMSSIIISKNEGSAKVDNWGIATLPHPQGVPAGWTVGSITPVAINQASNKKDAAWEFVKFITGEQGARMYAANGNISGLQNANILSIIASNKGMPSGLVDALATKNIVLDRPYDPLSAQVNTALGAEHGLIMLGEKTVDVGLADMAKRSKEIQGK